MDYLLDTHAFIWFINGDAQLSAEARKAIESKNGSKFVSIASIWEIAIKINLQKLELNRPFSEVPSQIINNGFQLLPITFEDTLIVSSLPFHHRDPFDRLIISQGLNNDLSIISRDKHFSDYGVKLIW